MATQLREATEPIASSVYDKSKEMYGAAKEWVPENYGKTIALGSAAVAIGLLGYYAGRGRKPSLPKLSEQPITKNTDNRTDIDLSPVFKFLKLWMLYRVAV